MELFNNHNIFSSFATLFTSHLYPIQVENCDSNSRRLVDEHNNDKFRLEMDKACLVKGFSIQDIQNVSQMTLDDI